MHKKHKSFEVQTTDCQASREATDPELLERGVHTSEYLRDMKSIGWIIFDWNLEPAILIYMIWLSATEPPPLSRHKTHSIWLETDTN